jgi:hypothetical protein
MARRIPPSPSDSLKENTSGTKKVKKEKTKEETRVKREGQQQRRKGRVLEEREQEQEEDVTDDEPSQQQEDADHDDLSDGEREQAARGPKRTRLNIQGDARASPAVADDEEDDGEPVEAVRVKVQTLPRDDDG